EVESINACGTSARSHTYAIEPSCLYSLLISPNPTSDESRVEIVAENGELETDEAWKLEIYDYDQILRIKQMEIKGSECKINTSDWRKGLYIVRISYRGEILYGRLVVS